MRAVFGATCIIYKVRDPRSLQRAIREISPPVGRSLIADRTRTAASTIRFRARIYRRMSTTPHRVLRGARLRAPLSAILGKVYDPVILDTARNCARAPPMTAFSLNARAPDAFGYARLTFDCRPPTEPRLSVPRLIFADKTDHATRIRKLQCDRRVD